MGKKEENLENLENPFDGFNLLKGEFASPANDEVEKVDSDIKSGDDDVIEEEDNLKTGDEALEKVIKKQEKAIKKQNVEEVEETEEEEVEETETEETVDNTGLREFADALYNKGVIDFDSKDEGFDNSEEAIETLINKTVQNRIDKWAKGLPEEYAKFLNFVQDGGSPKEFLDVYYGNQTWSDLNLESEDNQKMAVRESLRLSGESEEDIEDMIDEWEINGSLEKRAKSAINKLIKVEESQKEQIVQAQKRKAEEDANRNTQYWENFKNELYSKEEISGFKVTPKVKDNLWEFMTVVGRDGKTGYEKAIESNKDSSYLFAYLAMNNFDSSKLEKQVKTKVSNGLSKVLKNYEKSTKNKISSGSSEDASGGENPFSAFRNLK